MRKRKINPQYLRHITSQDVKDEAIDAIDLADSIKRFADDYLCGIMTLSVSGVSRGHVNLKLPVVTYLIRLLCECGDSDEMIEADITLGDDFTLSVSYVSKCPADDVAHIVKVARLAGFTVSRVDNTLIFKSDVKASSIMQIYATSNEDFYNLLVTTNKM